MNLNSDFLPFTKINSNWVTDLRVKDEIITILDDNTSESLDNLGYDNDFLDTKPNVQIWKLMIDKLEYIKVKNFCFGKDNVR